jgi:hypothetical protein
MARLHGVAADPEQLAHELAARGRLWSTQDILLAAKQLQLQARSVRSNIDRLPRLAGDSSELLQQDVAFESGGFEFIYTKSGEAKVEMMAEATKDARARAEQIAGQGGRKIKELRTARMGVVQINPLYSSATSWEGNNDTSSLDKTITTTVSATFALE